MDFDDINYDNEKLEQIWADVEELLRGRGRVHNYLLAQELDLDSYALSETTIEYEVLPRLRDAALKQEIIEVEREDTDQGNTRKVWVMQE